MSHDPVVGPTPHLSWAELACKDGTPYPDAWKRPRAIPLALEFELIRRACGGLPITILSGYRTPAHNRRVGGARHSQHVQGRALDLLPPDSMSVSEFYYRILAVADEYESKIKGVGLYPTFVHIDTRPSPYIVKWTGGRAKADG